MNVSTVTESDSKYYNILLRPLTLLFSFLLLCCDTKIHEDD